MYYDPKWKISGINRKTKRPVVLLLSGEGYTQSRIKEIFLETHPEIKVTSLTEYHENKRQRKKIQSR